MDELVDCTNIKAPLFLLGGDITMSIHETIENIQECTTSSQIAIGRCAELGQQCATFMAQRRGERSDWTAFQYEAVNTYFDKRENLAKVNECLAGLLHEQSLLTGASWLEPTAGRSSGWGLWFTKRLYRARHSLKENV